MLVPRSPRPSLSYTCLLLHPPAGDALARHGQLDVGHLAQHNEPCPPESPFQVDPVVRPIGCVLLMAGSGRVDAPQPHRRAEAGDGRYVLSRV